MTGTIPPTLAELRVPIDSLCEYARNPRRGNVEAIAESLEHNGQYRPIVVRAGTGEVLAGNHTLRAARQLGWEEIAATFVDVDDDQAARIVLVDNRMNDLAGYDEAELAGLLQSLSDLDGTGYGVGDVEQLLAELVQENGAGSDTDPLAPPVEPETKPGDLWLLGEHRLLCGDSTVADDVRKLQGGASLR